LLFYQAIVLIGRITDIARLSVSLFVCPTICPVPAPNNRKHAPEKPQQK